MSETISLEAITQIAHLARLGAENTQTLKKIQGELNNIVAMVGQISKVDTSGIEPMAHPLDLSQSLRADEVTEPNVRDKMQKLAPKTEAGLYLVPTVIEGGE